MFNLRKIPFLFLCVWQLSCQAQSFEWISKPMEYVDELVKIQETDLGDFFLIGNIDKSTGCYKLNKFGNLRWMQSNITSSAGLKDFVTLDGGKSFYVLGYGSFDRTSSLFFKVNNEKIEFEREIRTKDYFPTYFLPKPRNNLFFTVGDITYGFNNSAPLLQIRNMNGDTIKTIAISTKGSYGGLRIVDGVNSNIILFCGWPGTGSSLEGVVVLDSLGNKLSEKVYGQGVDGYSISDIDLVERDSSYFLLGGFSFNNSNKWKDDGYYIFEFNKNGDSIALHKFGPNEGLFSCLAKTKDKGFLVGGNSLIKLDSNYKVEWKKTLKENTKITSVGQAKDGGYYGAGSYYDDYSHVYHVYVFKTDENGIIPKPYSYPYLLLYPNPVEDELRVDLPFGENFTLSFYTLQGQLIEEYQTKGSTLLNLKFLQQGMYLVHLKDATGKVIKKEKLLKIN